MFETFKTNMSDSMCETEGHLSERCTTRRGIRVIQNTCTVLGGGGGEVFDLKKDLAMVRCKPREYGLSQMLLWLLLVCCLNLVREG